MTDFDFIYGRRPKVAIAHPMVGRGGSETSMMWLVEALKPDCDVTVITTKGWNLAQLNVFCGTQVREEEVNLRLIPFPFPDCVSAAGLRGAFFQRYLLRVAREYDVRISAYNPADWGAPAIHRLADFTWKREICEGFDSPSPGWVYRDSLLRKAYLGLCRMWSGKSSRDFLREDMIVANSNWSKEQLRNVLHIEQPIEVIYPPVRSDFREVEWEQKESSFVMIGRIAPEKRVEQAIEVLQAVRSKGHVLQLHLCGRIENDPYGQRIRALCKANRDWIIAEGQVAGERKAEMLSKYKYGILFGSREAFGIAAAEMIKAGAIVFAPAIGGQVEILNHDFLLFDTAENAVSKIDAVLRSGELQHQLRRHLGEQATKFTPMRFMMAWRQAVASYVTATRVFA